MKVYLFSNYLVKEFHLNQIIYKDLIDTDYTVDNCPLVGDCIHTGEFVFKVEERIYTSKGIILLILDYDIYNRQESKKLSNIITETVSRVLVDYVPIVIKGLFK